MPNSKDVLDTRDTTVRYLQGTDIPMDKVRAEAVRKYLASYSTGKPLHSLFEGSDSQRRNISYELIKTIMRKSTTIAAIVRRSVEDVLSPGYTFVPAMGIKDPDSDERDRVIKRFNSPSRDDISDEWLEGLVYDIVLFADCYLEFSGGRDQMVGSRDGGGTAGEIPVWGYKGPLQSWYHVPAETMWLSLNEHGETKDPPEPSYYHSVKGTTYGTSQSVVGVAGPGKSVYFTRDKIAHASRFKDGVYGTSPLVPLIMVLAAQFNLLNYVGKLHGGEVPKALMNVGDLDEGEVKSLIKLINQQIDTARNPFGIVTVNVPESFTVERLMDTAREGMFIELLNYYREDFCAVFGIHPSKLGWGELRGEEMMAMDTWYDVVESIHHKVEAIVNHTLLPLMNVKTWRFKFNSPRPRKEEHQARNRAMTSQAVMLLRKSNVITINEARTSYLDLEKLEEEWADDATYVPPKPGPGGTPGEPGSPPTEPEEPGSPPGESPEGPKPPARPPLEPGGGTSQRPPKPPPKEAIMTFEKGRPPDYVVEKAPDTVFDREVIRLTPFDKFVEDNNVYVMGIDDDDNDESGDN